ncbi:Peptidyl-prolyl cis-trans isomerase-like 2 [Galdieria sulphuraria]|nr:Peptidyl-prolyl cis-trans isomerase-like 2 [Galdieria sulphuraria]
MGKHKTKDRLFVTRTEHEFHFGGKRQFDSEYTPTAKLPLLHCALTFQPCENPVCAPDGTVFEVLHILPYLKKYGKHPVTGESLSSSQLISLKLHKNEKACIRTTGNVYSLEAVKELNLNQKYLKDLLTGEPFKKEDVIVLQSRKSYAQSVVKKRKENIERPSSVSNPNSRQNIVLDTRSLTCTTWCPDGGNKADSASEGPPIPKGYCTLLTNNGNLNFELDSYQAPKATRFFLLSLHRGCLNGIRLFYEASADYIRTVELQGLPGGEDEITESKLKGKIDPYVEESLPAYKLLVSSKYRLKKTCHFAISCEESKGLQGNYVVFGSLVGRRETAQALVQGLVDELVIEGVNIYVDPWEKEAKQ